MLAHAAHRLIGGGKLHQILAGDALQQQVDLLIGQRRPSGGHRIGEGLLLRGDPLLLFANSAFELRNRVSQGVLIIGKTKPAFPTAILRRGDPLLAQLGDLALHRLDLAARLPDLLLHLGDRGVRHHLERRAQKVADTRAFVGAELAQHEPRDAGFRIGLLAHARLGGFVENFLERPEQTPGALMPRVARARVGGVFRGMGGA